ncbi:MAG: O-antigen ligase family protein [Proteobacteria bacterium]|nr:O-antigen ligase family protein [Pseudomonadota bacterium]
MKNFFKSLKNPLLWPFCLFGPIAYGGGNGIIFLLGFLCISLFYKNFFLQKKSSRYAGSCFWDSLRSLSTPFIILFCFWAYMSLTIFWSFEPLYALKTTARLFCLFLLTLTLIVQLRNLPYDLLEKCLSCFVISWGILILLLFLSLLLDVMGNKNACIHAINFFKKPSQITRPALFASLFFWPSCAFFIFKTKKFFFQKRSLLFQETLLLTLGISIISLTYFLNMAASSLGLFLGLCVYFFFRLYPFFFSSFLNTMIGLGLIFPFCTKYLFNSFAFISLHKPSWAHRLVIWDFVSKFIKQSPFIGWGLEASRFLPTSTVEFFLPEKLSSLSLNTLPLHPHNAFLQVWLEGGVIGAFLLACFLWSLVSILKKSFPTSQEKALLGGTFVTFLIPFYVSFGIWQTWWLSTLCFITILWFFLKNRIKSNN